MRENRSFVFLVNNILIMLRVPMQLQGNISNLLSIGISATTILYR